GAARARPPGVGAERSPGGLRRRVHLPPCGRERPRCGHARRGARARTRPRPGHLDRPRLGPRRLECCPGFRGLRPGEARDVIVRWGLAELPGVLDDLAIERPLLVASPRWNELAIPASARWSELPSDRIAVPRDVDGILAV